MTVAPSEPFATAIVAHHYFNSFALRRKRFGIPPTPFRDFGLRLKQAMGGKGKKAPAVAKVVGKHQVTVRNWMRGKAMPDVGDLSLMATFLDVSLIWLKDGVGPMNAPAPVVREGTLAYGGELLSLQLTGAQLIQQAYDLGFRDGLASERPKGLLLGGGTAVPPPLPLEDDSPVGPHPAPPPVTGGGIPQTTEAGHAEPEPARADRSAASRSGRRGP